MKYLRPGLSSLLLFFAMHLCAQTAQLPRVQLSPSFPEPGEGFDKLLLLDNGYTCYLHFDKKQGIFITMYDAAHTVAATDTVIGKLWDATDISDTEIDGIYNINGQVVLFLQQLTKYKPNLYRLILDGHNGKLLQEDKLGELPTVLHRDVYVQGNDASHDFYIAKDPASGYYAVASFAGGELQRNEDPAKRISIQHFAPDHHLIQQYNYNLPAADWPYTAFLDLAVKGGEQVFLATAAMSVRKRDTASFVVVSVIRPGQETFTHTLLPYTAGFNEMHATLQYAAGPDRLQVLLTNLTDKSGKTMAVDMYMNYFDARSLALLYHGPVSREKVTTYAKNHMKYTGDYTGQPQGLITHPDGSSTLLMENMTQFSTQGNNAWNKIHTNLDDIGVSTLDATGAEQAGYALIKMQTANGSYQPFYLHRKNRGQWIFRNRIQALNTTPYLSYDYLPTSHGTYILFNDYLQYLDVGGVFQDKKPLRYLTEANAVCYRINGDTSEKLFLFGTPETMKGYYCMLGSSDYHVENGTYVTIMITRKGEEKKACVAWVQL